MGNRSSCEETKTEGPNSESVIRKTGYAVDYSISFSILATWFLKRHTRRHIWNLGAGFPTKTPALPIWNGFVGRLVLHVLTVTTESRGLFDQGSRSARNATGGLQ
jgi:hypothetical protein